ncbi:hypothetical protein PUN28_011171 [Cardiocondyla obscurior]|uniref:Transposase n=1 Tax=Cardiocondyla obscurior TaxID=286306 RepID=A0AAW2FM47_9HYME
MKMFCVRESASDLAALLKKSFRKTRSSWSNDIAREYRARNASVCNIRTLKRKRLGWNPPSAVSLATFVDLELLIFPLTSNCQLFPYSGKNGRTDVRVEQLNGTRVRELVHTRLVPDLTASVPRDSDDTTLHGKRRAALCFQNQTHRRRPRLPRERYGRAATAATAAATMTTTTTTTTTTTSNDDDAAAAARGAEERRGKGKLSKVCSTRMYNTYVLVS